MRPRVPLTTLDCAFLRRYNERSCRCRWGSRRRTSETTMRGVVLGMRRTRIVGCGVALACVLGAIGASSAAAALPEWGRCVKVSGTGEFTRENCIPVSKTHTGNYEWAPGPGEKPGAKTRFLGLTLETTGKKQIKCEFAFLEEGAITSSKELKVKKVTMQGCIMVGTPFRCYTNPSETGTIESTTPLNGEIGFIPGSKTVASPWVGLDLKPESEGTKKLVEATCGEAK